MTLRSEYKVTVVQSGTSFIANIAICAVAGGCTVLFLLIVSTASTFTCQDVGVPAGCDEEGGNYVSDATGPALLCFILAFLVANSFIAVYTVVANTMLFAFMSEAASRKRQEKNGG